MIKTKHIYLIGILLSLLYNCQEKTNEIISDTIQFEISDYNLLFTEVEINDKAYTALIDFGDFAEFQVSTKLIAELNLETKQSDIIMFDINGNQYALEKGTIETLTVGGQVVNDAPFYSAKNEIEAVSKEVGTDFQVVIGFGYFKSKDFKLDFTENSIAFISPEVDDADFTVSVSNDHGYLIGNFISDENKDVNLLFDTGTPISKIDLNQLPLSLKDSTVIFQDTPFPSKTLNILSNDQTITLNLENGDISELQPLGAVGIYGVNDMIGKVFYYSGSEKSLHIKD